MRGPAAAFRKPCYRLKILGPTASVVCRRANIVLMTVPARRGGTAWTQRQANSSAKGIADTQKGLCVYRGLPSVIFYTVRNAFAQNFFLSRGITHCLCAQSSTIVVLLQVIYFTTDTNNDHSALRHSIYNYYTLLTISRWHSTLPADRHTKMHTSARAKKRTRLHNQPGSFKKLTNKNYFSGAALLSQPHVVAASPVADSASWSSASTGLSECKFICCRPSVHCGTCKPMRAS